MKLSIGDHIKHTMLVLLRTPKLFERFEKIMEEIEQLAADIDKEISKSVSKG